MPPLLYLRMSITTWTYRRRTSSASCMIRPRPLTWSTTMYCLKNSKPWKLDRIPLKWIASYLRDRRLVVTLKHLDSQYVLQPVKPTVSSPINVGLSQGSNQTQTIGPFVFSSEISWNKFNFPLEKDNVAIRYTTVLYNSTRSGYAFMIWVLWFLRFCDPLVSGFWLYCIEIQYLFS